jgi:hypothetical protein
VISFTCVRSNVHLFCSFCESFPCFFNVLMTVIIVAECQLLPGHDSASHILHKEKPVSSFSSGTGLVTASSDSGSKLTSSLVPNARNVVSSFYHLYSLCLI